jgi:DNA-binding NarL/FixJ family response regulator
MTKINVLLVDDHTILREGLRALLSCYDDVQVVGEAKNGALALQQVEALQPAIVIMDIAMPVMDGFESTRLIRQKYPETRVLVLTQYEDKEYHVMFSGVAYAD